MTLAKAIPCVCGKRFFNAHTSSFCLLTAGFRFAKVRNIAIGRAF